MQTKLLFNQPFSFDDVVITEQPTTLDLNEEQTTQLESEWASMKEKALAEGKKAFDGLTYRLNSFSIDDGKLYLEIAELPFRYRRTLEMKMDDLGNEDLCPNSLAVGTIVETSDNYYLFAKLSGNTLTDRAYSMLGGVASKDDQIIENSSDLWQMYLRELEEEGGILPEYIADKTIEGLMRSKRGVHALISHVRITLSSDQAREVFSQRTDDETSALNVATATELMEFPAFVNYLGAQIPLMKRITEK